MIININANELTDKDRYKVLTGSIVPRPIAWVTTRNRNGVINAAPFSYFNIISSSPAIVSLSINRSNYNKKDTTNNILGNGEAVIQIVDNENVRQMNQTAAKLSPDSSEVQLAHLTTAASDLIAVPRIRDTKIQLETKLYQHVPVKYGGIVVSDLLLMEVLRFHFNDDIYDSKHHYVLDDEVNPISRLAGNNYGTLGELFQLKRPN